MKSHLRGGLLFDHLIEIRQSKKNFFLFNIFVCFDRTMRYNY